MRLAQLWQAIGASFGVRSSTTPKFLYSVECLRGLAALSVTWFHLTNNFAASWVKSSGQLGWLGVEAFFVISGFIIPYSLFLSDYKVSQFWRFILRRMVRLEPPYLLSIIIVVSLAYLSASVPGFRGEAPSYCLPQIAAHLLYVVPLTRYSWINVVYWTLAYEFVFYIFAGLAYPALVKKAAFPLQILLLSLFCCLVLYQALPSQLLLFALGVMSFRCLVGIDSIVCYLALVALLGVTIAHISGAIYLFVVLTTCGVLVFVRVPHFAALGFLGSISYSLYLLHVPIGGRIINLGRRICDSSECDFGLSILALLVCLVAATVYWRLIEQPAHAASKCISLD